MSRFNKGFSLLEVMVAFVVMGLVVGVILQLFGSSMNSVALSDEYSFAVQVAESRLATVGNEIEVQDGNESGEEKGSGYRWEVQMAPIKLSDEMEKLPLPLQLYRVEVVVTWKSGDKSREFHLSSLRFGEKS
ncbi:prepilin-type N-terminal cleavage/methylation domain-containing protein [Thiothrix litoralis]|uniref:Prepilin-type N-terminal cleavage/methylation domain-containing protein n=1 Tax=Thiothrix litoralis TaxID=2891210 RepID=A0ABX7WNA0_9GAMM|nr:prepilin-type N-terminal cleavage/methylation domain-containing protein [Thiothrix litoralis]QTR44885.1 prepilin-type N-terminal cleavage/methylation domain-containing protein [Thiothrix litoralis]